MSPNKNINPISHALRSFLKKCGLDIPENTSLKWIGAAVIGFIVIVYFANLGYKLIDRANDKVADHIVPKPAEGQVASATDDIREEVQEVCKDVACEDFTDLSHWLKAENFTIVSNSPLRIIAPASQNFAGWIMDYYQPIPLSSEVHFSFIPHSDKSNVVVRFKGLYELIIGDDGYSRVSLKDTKGYVMPSGYKIKHFPLQSPMSKGSLVRIKIEHESIKGTNKVKVKPVITYFDLSGAERTESKIEFTISAENDPSDISGVLGVGLLDTHKTGKIEATFQQLIVRELIF